MLLLTVNSLTPGVTATAVFIARVSFLFTFMRVLRNSSASLALGSICAKFSYLDQPFACSRRPAPGNTLTRLDDSLRLNQLLMIKHR
ncbi:hypothetical protein CPB85DRAFT_756602 [Mucidula mucida]|nr:hypothetical protein CPB85DRAFT_756602 [Mucidula mucida]